MYVLWDNSEGYPEIKEVEVVQENLHTIRVLVDGNEYTYDKNKVFNTKESIEKYFNIFTLEKAKNKINFLENKVECLSKELKQNKKYIEKFNKDIKNIKDVLSVGISHKFYKIYEGFIHLRDAESPEIGGDEIYLKNEKESFFLAEKICSDIDTYGNIVCVNYYITDKDVSYNEAKCEHLEQLFGKIECEFEVFYSDITGYLGCDPELNIGGHNLREELCSKEGKYLNLYIKFIGSK
jgi:hypothetical protein